MSRAKGCWTQYVRVVGGIERFVSQALGKLSALVASAPVRVIVISTLISLAFGAGWARLPSLIEDEGDKLWVPQGSQWKRYEDWLEPRLGKSDRSLQFIWEAPNGSDNVLTAGSIREMFRTMDIAFGVTASMDGATYIWDDLCWQSTTGNGCRNSGILKLFNNSAAVFEATAAQGDAALAAALSATIYPDGSAVNQAGIFAEAEWAADGTVQRARLAAQQYSGDPKADENNLSDWATKLEDTLLPVIEGETSEPFTATVVHFSHYDSVDNAISESIGGDIALVVVAIVIVMILASAALHVNDLVFTRASLGLCGVLSVVLSIVGGYGFALLIGIPFTSLSQLLPFILLGIGIDDMFVLVRSMEEVDAKHPGLEEKERFRKCLQQGGMSITVTSLTNCAAFLFGSMTSIPAVRWFCWYAAISIAFDWALQITFFLSCFVLTERRIAASRYECACCATRSAAKTLEAAERQTHVERTASGREVRRFRTGFPLAPANPIMLSAAHAQLDAGAEREIQPTVSASLDVDAAEAGKQPTAKSLGRESVSKPKVGLLSASKDSLIQIFLNKVLLSWLLHPAAAAVIILVTLAAAACGIYGLTQLGEGLPLSALAPDGHYLKAFDAADLLFVSNSGAPTDIYFRYLDQSSEDVQLRMLATYADATNNYDYIDPKISPDATWLTAFHDYVTSSSPADANADGTIAQGSFYTHLDAFLTAQPYWQEHVGRFPNGDIETSFFRAYHTGNPGNEGSYERKALNEVIDIIDDVNDAHFAAENGGRSGSDRIVFLYAPWYVYGETGRVIFTELATNLGFALLGVGLISAIFLIHPVAVLLVIGAVALVDVLLFLELWVFDIHVNTVSVVNLVMAVGLAVDYSLHVIHTFISTYNGTRRERAKRTMLEIGAAVLVGALSTLLGVVALAGSSSEIFRTFFALLLGTVLCGGYVGLVLMPVVLSLIGPQACLGIAPGREAESPAGEAVAEARSAQDAEVAVVTLPRSSPASVLPLDAEPSRPEVCVQPA